MTFKSNFEWREIDEVEWAPNSSEWRDGYYNPDEIDLDFRESEDFLQHGSSDNPNDAQTYEPAYGIDLFAPITPWNWPNDCDWLERFLKLSQDLSNWNLTYEQCLKILIFATSGEEDKRQMLIQLELSQ